MKRLFNENYGLLVRGALIFHTITKVKPKIGVDKTWIGSSDQIIGPDHRIRSSDQIIGLNRQIELSDLKIYNNKSNNKIKQKESSNKNVTHADRKSSCFKRI